MNYDFTDLIDEELGAKLARYVAGRSPAGEVEEIRAWIAAGVGRDEFVESLRRAWVVAQQSRGEWDVDAAWDEFRMRRQARRGHARHVAAMAPARVRWRVPAWVVRAAAVLVLVLGGAVVWTKMSRPVPEAPRPVAMQEYATSRAQHAEMRLPDGTRVVLSVESRLRVPEDYGKTTRTVYLEGEALFEVQHDERRPFFVHAGNLIAEDLGTVFGVRSYADDAEATVVVAEGIVEVEATPASQHEPSAAHRLDPGHLARVAADGTVRVERGVDLDAYLAFAQRRLVFNNTPLREAAAQLGRWYDLDVRVADASIAELPLTARFQHEPASRVIQLVALSLDLQYERDGNVVKFYR